MTIEIDQSGRVEFTSHDTVIADSLGNYIWLSKKDKREIQKLYRKEERPKMFTLEVFSALIIHLIAISISPEQIYIIDQEYLGNENLIKAFIVVFANRLNVNLHKENIHFGYVGKKSLSHKYAYQEFKKKVKLSSRRVNIETILKIVNIKKD